MSQPTSTNLSPWLRAGLGILLAACAVGLLLLAMPPLGWWPLAIIGWVPMIVAQHRVMPARLSSLAPALTISGFLGGTFALIYGEVFWQTGILKFLPLIIAAIVLLTDFKARTFHRQTGYRWLVLEGAFVWVGIEMIRNLIPFLGTGGFIGYAFFRAPLLIQPVSVFGMFGLDLLVMLLGYTLGLGALGWLDRRGLTFGEGPVAGRQVTRWLVGTGAAALAWTLASLVMFWLPVSTPTVRVAAIQPGAPDINRYAPLTRQAADQGAQLVVWPEGAFSSDPRTHYRGLIADLTAETGVTVITGYGYRNATTGINEATAITPGGEFLPPYAKDHPITLLGEISDTRGSYPVYDLPFGTVSTIICYDMIFTDTARRLAGQGAALIAAPSNDWPALYNKEYAHLVFRAVENRTAMVKADTRYDSAVIDARGRVIALHATSEPSQFVLVADVPLGPLGAPQTFLGDWMGWIALAGLAFFSLPNPLLKARRAPVPTPAEA